jgi:hypothetical protein
MFPHASLSSQLEPWERQLVRAKMSTIPPPRTVVRFLLNLFLTRCFHSFLCIF